MWRLIMAVIGGCVLVTSGARAQLAEELIAISVEVVSKAKSQGEAVREAQAQVMAETARAQVIEIVGEKRYQQNRPVIEAKIVRQAAKFIPVVNPGRARQQPDGTWKVPVEVKLSASSIRRMVLETGILSDAEGPASIVPLVAVVDRTKGLTVRWWLGETRAQPYGSLLELNRSFHEILQGEFSRHGFHLIRPQGSQNSPLPEHLRSERPSLGEMRSIAQYYNAPMFMKGEVRFRESETSPGEVVCQIRLQVVHAGTDRSVAEASRAFEVGSGNMESAIRTRMTAELPDIAKDLSQQVLDAWQRGTLNANLIRLAVRGNLTPQHLAEFKSGLLRSVKEVKGLKERLFDQGQVTFEVDYTGEEKRLAEKLGRLQIPNFAIRLAESSGTNLTLEVRAR